MSLAQRTGGPSYRPIGPEPAPIHFPSDEKRMEGKWHRLVCKVLYDLLKVALGDGALLAWDQFLYWDATDPKQKAAPDVFGRVGEPDRLFPSWKVWELGVPQFCIEVVSESSWPSDVVEQPPVYDRLGVGEVVVFDPEPGARSPSRGQIARSLRVWRRAAGGLVELALPEPDRYYSETLGLWLRVVPADEQLSWLRLATGAHGEDLVPSPEDQGRAEGEATGRAEGEARGRAEALLAVLSARGLRPTDDQRAYILRCTDVAALERWLARALSAASLDGSPSGLGEA